MKCIHFQKNKGRLRPRSIREYQLALQAKDAARCVASPSLWATMTKQKYDAQEEFWYMMQMGDCSLNWKVLCERVDVIEVDLEREVGNGAFTDAINDKWINGKSLMDLQMLENQEMLLPSTAVADMMVDKEWDNRALEQ